MCVCVGGGQLLLLTEGSGLLQDVVSPEETASSQSEHPDTEFEGMGDYEESFIADWWQEPKTKGDAGEVED